MSNSKFKDYNILYKRVKGNYKLTLLIFISIKQLLRHAEASMTRNFRRHRKHKE